MASKEAIIFLACGCLLGIGVLTFIAEPQDPALALAVAAVLMPLGTVTAAWLAQKTSIAINGRIALKTQPVMRDEFTYEAQPGCLIQRSRHGESIARWSELKAFSEDNDIWLLYPDFLPRRYYMLPKRSLTPEFDRALSDNLQSADVPRR